MRYLPLFFDTHDRRIVLAGEGATAAARLRLLAGSEARIDVFAPIPGPELAAALAETGARHHLRWPRSADLAGALCVHAASGVAEIDGRISRRARICGVPATVMDNAAAGDFIMPAIVDRDPVVVAVGSGGAAPMLARMIRAELEARLPAVIGPLARLAEGMRPEVARRVAPGAPRRRLWARFFGRLGPAAWMRGGAGAARSALEGLIAAAAGGQEQRQGQGAVPALDLVLAPALEADRLPGPARRALADTDLVLIDPSLGVGARQRLARLLRREARLLPIGTAGTARANERVTAVIAALPGAARIQPLRAALAGLGRPIRTHVEAEAPARVGAAANLDRAPAARTGAREIAP